jgi:hypothetical protein
MVINGKCFFVSVPSLTGEIGLQVGLNRRSGVQHQSPGRLPRGKEAEWGGTYQVLAARHLATHLQV